MELYDREAKDTGRELITIRRARSDAALDSPTGKMGDLKGAMTAWNELEQRRMVVSRFLRERYRTLRIVWWQLLD